MPSNFALSQILIGIAIGVDILSFQFKARNKILICLVVSTTLIAGHFMLLGHWTAALLGLLSVVRYGTSIFTTSKKVMWIFLLLIGAISACSFEGILSVVSAVATGLSTVAAFHKDDQRLRQLMLVATTLWIGHNYFAGSPGAVIMEMLFMGSNLVGYYRYYIKSQS